MITYHFVKGTLRDGRPVPADGEWLEHKGSLVMCESGLHASAHPFDALRYAPGATLCLVELDGEIIDGGDKVIARRRKIIRRVGMTDQLRAFARRCALDVAHLWNCPPVVRQYLETGDESLREEARAAAAAATWDMAWAKYRDQFKVMVDEAFREVAK